MTDANNQGSHATDYNVCPIPAAHRRLAEAHLLWHQALTPKVAALIMVLLFLPVHYVLWAKFPIWYHPILFDYAGIHDAD